MADRGNVADSELEDSNQFLFSRILFEGPAITRAEFSVLKIRDAWILSQQLLHQITVGLLKFRCGSSVDFANALYKQLADVNLAALPQIDREHVDQPIEIQALCSILGNLLPKPLAEPNKQPFANHVESDMSHSCRINQLKRHLHLELERIILIRNQWSHSASNNLHQYSSTDCLWSLCHLLDQFIQLIDFESKGPDDDIFNIFVGLKVDIASVRLKLWNLFSILCAPDELDCSVQLPVSSYAAVVFLRGVEIVQQTAQSCQQFPKSNSLNFFEFADHVHHASDSVFALPPCFAQKTHKFADLTRVATLRWEFWHGNRPLDVIDVKEYLIACTRILDLVPDEQGSRSPSHLVYSSSVQQLVRLILFSDYIHIC
jgi:hypothetical protein